MWFGYQIHETCGKDTAGKTDGSEPGGRTLYPEQDASLYQCQVLKDGSMDN